MEAIAGRILKLSSSVDATKHSARRGSRRDSFDTAQLRLSRRTEYMGDDLSPEMTYLKPRQLEQWHMYANSSTKSLTATVNLKKDLILRCK